MPALLVECRPEQYYCVKSDDPVEVMKSGDHRLMRRDFAGQREQEDCAKAGIWSSP